MFGCNQYSYGGWCKTAKGDPAPEHQTLQLNLCAVPTRDRPQVKLHPALASAGPGPCNRSPLSGGFHPDSESRTGVEAGLSAFCMPLVSEALPLWESGAVGQVDGLNGQTGETSLEEVRPGDHLIRFESKSTYANASLPYPLSCGQRPFGAPSGRGGALAIFLSPFLQVFLICSMVKPARLLSRK